MKSVVNESDTASSENAPGTADSIKVENRLTSIDAYRGMVMFLMLSELIHLYDLKSLYPNSAVFSWLAFHTTHVEWEGCSLHDLIQPSFTFLVGAAMPFSIASRIRKGHSTLRLLGHAAWRSCILIALGIVLRSQGREQTNFTFEDTLTQIGLGYLFVVAIALLPKWVSYASVAVILIGFWSIYAIDAPPANEFDYASVGVPDEWPHHDDGFASRWNKNSNLSWRWDTWFLNLFPREEPFTHNGGGYSTFSFIPTMVTMIFGLIAGRWLCVPMPPSDRLKRLLLSAAIGIALGWTLSATDLCPNVKRIWTPSFALFSGGCLMAWLAALHLITDIAGFRRWAWPFIIIGSNSILVYVMAETIGHSTGEVLLRHFGHAPFQILGAGLEPSLLGIATLAIFFAVLAWLYNRRVFIRI
jgi:heparan-alpha-glucosaminide N-acetyltransferase